MRTNGQIFFHNFVSFRFVGMNFHGIVTKVKSPATFEMKFQIQTRFNEVKFFVVHQTKHKLYFLFLSL